MEKDFVDLTPQELNSFLNKRYGFGLQPFAVILSQVFLLASIDKGTYLSSAQKLSDEIKKYARLKGKIISTLIELSPADDGSGKDFFGVDRDESTLAAYKIDPERVRMDLIKEFGIEYFFKCIDQGIATRKRELKLRTPGIGIKKKTLIAISWIFLTKLKAGKIEWELIADLLDWFGRKLTPYWKIGYLNFEENLFVDLSYLKEQFYRNRKKARPYFDYSMSTYYKNSFPETPHTVILGKGVHTLAPHRLVLAISCGKDPAGPHLPIQDLFDEAVLSGKLELMYPEIKGLMIGNAELVALLNHAAKLYKKNHSSLPLIIFPDLSYL